MTTEITFEIIPANSGLEPPQRESLQVSFAPYFQQAADLKIATDAITEPKEARAARLELRKVRTGAEATRKTLKEESLRMGKAIDGANNILLAMIVPIEEKMEAIEKAAERAELNRISAIVADRTERLQEVGGVIPSNLGVLTDDQFTAILKDAAELQRIKAEREAKEETERLAKIEADRIERERIAEENERLKAEAAETARLAKIESDRIAAERVEEQRKARAEQEKREAAFAAERAKAEAAARAERDKADAERRKLEAEAAQARKAAEAAQAKIREQEAEAERAKEAEAAARANAAKAPDADKLASLLGAIKSLQVPELATDDGKAAVVKIRAILNTTYSQIKTIISDL